MKNKDFYFKDERLSEFSPYYLSQKENGFYRAPFAFLAFLGEEEISKITSEENEKRAIENLHIFSHSFIIILRRIKNGIERGRKTEIVTLYLDVQSLFLFGEQFLQDVGLVLRRFLPPKMRHNISPKFHRLRKQLTELECNHEFQKYLQNNQQWFDIWNDLRDDISHHTSFDKLRKAVFPSVGSFGAILSGNESFILEGKTLKKYVLEYIDKLLSFACVAEDFIKSRFINLKKSYFIGHQVELVIFHEQFTVGVGAVTIGEADINILKWWFENRI